MLAFFVGVAGSIGALARYSIDWTVKRSFADPFPLGTLVVNIVGSLVLGFVTGVVWYHAGSAEMRAIIGTGFCGGLTTWSSASWETVQLAEDGEWGRAGANAIGGLALSMLAAGAGIGLAALL